MALDLRPEHPSRAPLLLQWREASDLYLGGRHVVNADYNAGRGVFLSSTESGSRYYTSDYPSYLWSHSRESEQGFRDRTRRAVHLPVLRHVIDTYVSAAMRRPPTREGLSEPWSSFAEDCDLHGTTLDAMLRVGLARALQYSQELGVVDLTPDGRPYLSLRDPVDLMDWEVDGQGAFLWAVLREDSCPQRLPGEAHGEPLVRRRLWTRDVWVLTEGSAGSRGEIVDEGTHGLGRVPIAMLRARQDRESSAVLSADSLLADLPRLDRSIFNQFSLLHEQIYLQCFSQLFVPADDIGGPTPIELGPSTAVTYNAQAGQPLMLSPDASVILAQWQILLQTLQTVREYAGITRGKAEYSKEERSADALMVELGDAHNRVAGLVESVEIFEHDIMKIVALWTGRDPDDVVRPQYGRDVSQQSLSAAIDGALKFKQLGVMGDTLREILQPSLSRYLREQGVADSAIADTIASLSSADSPSPSEI